MRELEERVRTTRTILPNEAVFSRVRRGSCEMSVQAEMCAEFWEEASC